MKPVQQAYDRWSATYDQDRNATRDLDAEVVRNAGLRLRDAAVLELGCGTGKNTVYFAEHAARVLAVDFSDGMIARARQRVASPHVAFLRHDVREPWPVDSGSLDLVVANLVLEHVRDLAPVYAEAARVLRPCGQLFLCELHPYRQLAGGQAHFTDGESGETVYVDVHVHTVGEFVNGGIDAGFRLAALGEWIEGGAAPGAAPRLLSLLFERSR